MTALLLLLFTLCKPPQVTEQCTITVQQVGYVAGECSNGRFFGENTKRWRAMPPGTPVTVRGKLDPSGEIYRETITIRR